VPATAIIEGAIWALASGTLAACIIILLRVGLSCWRRTARLRCGDAAALRLQPRTPVAGGRTSMLTYAPAIAGVAVVAMCALAAISMAHPFVALGLAAGGFVVAVSGLWGRVTAINFNQDGVIVHYAWRGPFSVRWTECSAIRPPRWPLGGWEIRRADGHARLLMPSDLLGLERLLAQAVARSHLVFDRRGWLRPDVLRSGWGWPKRSARVSARREDLRP
jgi:hypothetical protein